MAETWFGHGYAGCRILSQMAEIRAWAWIRWLSDSLANGRNPGLGMGLRCLSDSLANGRKPGLGMDTQFVGFSRKWPKSGFGHGYAGCRILSQMSENLVWAWIRWLSDSLANGRKPGLGMDTVVVERFSRKWPKSGFGHGYGGCRILSQMAENLVLAWIRSLSKKNGPGCMRIPRSWIRSLSKKNGPGCKPGAVFSNRGHFFCASGQPPRHAAGGVWWGGVGWVGYPGLGMGMLVVGFSRKCPKTWFLGMDTVVVGFSRKWPKSRFGHGSTLLVGFSRKCPKTWFGHAWIRSLSDSLANGRNPGLGMGLRCLSDSLANGRNPGLGMGMLVVGFSRKWPKTWFGHGYGGCRILSQMAENLVWAWIRCLSDSLANGRKPGLGMDTLVVAILVLDARGV